LVIGRLDGFYNLKISKIIGKLVNDFYWLSALSLATKYELLGNFGLLPFAITLLINLRSFMLGFKFFSVLVFGKW